MRPIRILLPLFLLTLFLGCASSGSAIRPSYKGEPKTPRSRTKTSQKNSGKTDRKADNKLPSPEKSISTPKPEEKKVLSISKIESKASKYIGIRYKYGGTTTKGFDCSGYVWRVYNDMGFDFARSSSRVYFKKGKKVSRKHAKKGDLVFFKERGKISHVGIYLEDDRFIHSSSSRGIIESSLTNSYWKSKIAGFRRYF